jgi:virginiamycin B lyase
LPEADRSPPTVASWRRVLNSWPAVGIAAIALLALVAAATVYSLQHHAQGIALGPAATPSGHASATPTATPAVSPSATATTLSAQVSATSDGIWTAFTVPLNSTALRVGSITSGSDGGLWFTVADTQHPQTGAIGRIDGAGHLALYQLSTALAAPAVITPGPDGALWFTEQGLGMAKIGRISVTGGITEYPLPSAGSSGPLVGISAGPDGALWFADLGDNTIGRITVAGQVREFALPPLPSSPCGVCPKGIAAGSDGNLWFTESQLGRARVARITPSGQLTEYPVPGGVAPDQITIGPDANLWFTDAHAGQIGRVAAGGSVSVHRLHTASLGAVGSGIAAGPDGATWFTVAKAAPGVAATGNQLGRIDSSGTITGFIIPGDGQVGPGIVTGQDRGIWFTYDSNQVWRFVPSS